MNNGMGLSVVFGAELGNLNNNGINRCVDPEPWNKTPPDMIKLVPIKGFKSVKSQILAR